MRAVPLLPPSYQLNGGFKGTTMRTAGAQECGHTMRTTGAHPATGRTRNDTEVTTLEEPTGQLEYDKNDELEVAKNPLTIDQAYLNETGAGFLATPVSTSIDVTTPSSTTDHAAVSSLDSAPQRPTSLTPNVGSTAPETGVLPLQDYGGTQSTHYPVLGTEYVLGTSPTDVHTVRRHFNRDSIEMPVLTTSSSTVDRAASAVLSAMAKQLRKTNFCPSPSVSKRDERRDSCYGEQLIQ